MWWTLSLSLALCGHSKGTSSKDRIQQKTHELSSILDCKIYAPQSEDIESFNVSPNIEYVTYSSYDIDPDRYEDIWSIDPGLNEERWAREQDHFYHVLEELGERGAFIAMDLFLRTDEQSVYLHQFPMEKIAHDQLLRNEFQIDADYQHKKKWVQRNWYHFKKRYIEQFNADTAGSKPSGRCECSKFSEQKHGDHDDHDNAVHGTSTSAETASLRVYADDLELDEPLILQPLFEDAVDEKEQSLCPQTVDLTTDSKVPQKPKYHSLSIKKKEKRSPKRMSFRTLYSLFIFWLTESDWPSVYSNGQ